MIAHINILIDQLQHHPYKRYGTRTLESIDRIIIHHSGTKNGKASSYADYHVNDKDWPGIGYHMVSDSDGINQTNDFTTISYHTGGKNTNSIGICQTGNFDLVEPTDEEYWNYIQMILHIDNVLGRQEPVEYHRNHSDTTCPGMLFDIEKFEKELNDFRFIYG